MDVQNVNPLNVRLNMISGNLLPITDEDLSFAVPWRIYNIVIWLIQLIQICATIYGFVSVANREALQDAGTMGILVSVEVLILLTRMYANRNLGRQLIQKLNSLLRTEDESMKNIVHSTLKPLEIPLEFYYIGGTGSPFSTKVFVLGNLFETISCAFIFLKKVAMDVYMINLVLLLTTQYRYVAVKLATILRNDSSQNEDHECQKNDRPADLLVEKKMKALCQHYSSVIFTTLMLKKFLFLNMSFIYLNNIFRFCFIDLLFINAIRSGAIYEVALLIIYVCGALVQLYIVCFCVHQLLDASKEVTDIAFHEQWYEFKPSVKHMFRMIIMANNLKIKLSVSENFSLSLPSFLAILNQSYSVALLLLKVK
ncbi:odorant receptor 22c-like isoform X2 [Solenopsis invicta]|uniref:odorant receptor 22c-like isoform X2 n=1 Tax=Solenopsis invicta TaxID=13686 RepID=UPI00193E8C39|nr:odorant receptor 22c-like isoform X2 [Solenopsis invicta]